MSLNQSRMGLCALLMAVLFTTAAVSIDYSASLKAGKAELQSAGPLAFGPDGVLFVGDSMGAAVFALATEDTASSSPGRVDISGINEKVAALLGTSADQILINDVAVNPASKKVYLSVSRGRGPDATPLIVRVDASGKLEEVLSGKREARPGSPSPMLLTPTPRIAEARAFDWKPSPTWPLSTTGSSSQGFPTKNSPPSCTPSLFPLTRRAAEPALRFTMAPTGVSKPTLRFALSSPMKLRKSPTSWRHTPAPPW